MSETVTRQVLENIAYREEPDQTAYMRERCRLDLYIPGGAGGFATVVWFHAGGMIEGDRYVPEELRNRGIAVATVDYRLHPHVNAPAYIEDAAAAVAWVFKNIEAYGGSAGRVVVAGASAGGYLAALVTLDRKWLAAHDVDADRIAGLASISGQAITHFTVRQERGIAGEHPVIDDLAPLYHVRGDAPPILLITGDRELELLGRYEENAYFQRMLTVAGHKHTTLHELPGRDHAGVEGPAHAYLLEFVRNVTSTNASLGGDR